MFNILNKFAMYYKEINSNIYLNILLLFYDIWKLPHILSKCKLIIKGIIRKNE